MKAFLLSVLALSLSFGLLAQLSCYEIQYTEAANYSSPYAGQNVSVKGIVTAIRSGQGVYLGDEEGGAWSGLYVQDATAANDFVLGDKVQIAGKVVELQGITTLSTVSARNKLSSNNPIPITALSTADLPFDNAALSERYEGVLVRLNNVQIKSPMDNFGMFTVADESGTLSKLDDVLYAPQASSIVVDEWWFQMQGVVDFHTSAGYKILPRNSDDMIKVDDVSSSVITLKGVSNAQPNQNCLMEVITTKLNSEWAVGEYRMRISFDPADVLFQGYDTSGTLSQGSMNYTLSNAGDVVDFHFVATNPMVSAEAAKLLKLKFMPLSFGDITIHLESFSYNDINIRALTDGVINAKISKNIAYLNITTLKAGNNIDRKNIFDPTQNEKVNFEYGTKTGFLARALIRIYDAQGRLVATPVNQNIISTTGIDNFSWNGRDSNMKPLSPGLYYCHLEVSNRETGARYKTVQPVVIKSRLK